MTACAVLLLIFGVVTFVRDGWSWFSALWLVAVLLVLGGFVRRFFRTGARRSQTTADGGVERPSKPMAVLSAAVGSGLMIFGIVQFGRADPLFLVMWVAFLFLIVGGQLWSAFGRAR